MTKVIATSVALLVGVTSLGCKDREACERARMELAEQWTEVKNNAARRHIKDVATAVPAEEAGTYVENWKRIEDRAELVATSFQTPQVTWDAAEKASTEIDQHFAPYKTSDRLELRGFARLLKDAMQQYTSFEDQCR